jgi:hypothetical protein
MSDTLLVIVVCDRIETTSHAAECALIWPMSGRTHADVAASAFRR